MNESYKSIPETNDSDKTEYDYSLDNLDNDLVLHYQPKFVARGGEHLVYEIPDHPGVVVKIRIGKLKKLLEHNYEGGQPLDSLSPEIQSQADSLLETERNRYQKLREHFGREHVPSQRKYLLKVPITEDIVRSFYDGQLPVSPVEVWSVAMIQKRISELDEPHLSLTSGYAEHSEPVPKTYRKANEFLIEGKKLDTPFSTEDFLSVQSNEWLGNIVEQSEADEGLKNTLKNLVNKIISYTTDTGEILDLAGKDNIILHQENGSWSYTLVDARYPGTNNMVETVKMILLKNESGDKLSDSEKNNLLNTINYVRTVNGLAEQLGISDRIHIIPEELSNKSFDFLDLAK